MTPNLTAPASFQPDPQGTKQSLAWPHPWSSSLSLGFLIPTGRILPTLQASGGWGGRGAFNSNSQHLFLLFWKVRSGLPHTAVTP